MSLRDFIAQYSEAAIAIPAIAANSELKQDPEIADIAKIAIATGENQKSALIHWSDFVACCIAQGVTEAEVQAMFRQIDIDDLCGEPASNLTKHAGTIVAAILRERPVQPPVQSVSDGLHQCGQCRHFTANPYAGTAGLGWCNVRDELPMTLPNRVIECSQFKGTATSSNSELKQHPEIAEIAVATGENKKAR